MKTKSTWYGTNTHGMSDPLYIGVLSGTSMDAVDVALVSFASSTPQLIKTINYPIPDAFRSHCLRLCQSGGGSIDDYGSLDTQAGEIFSEAVIRMLQLTHYSAKQIRAIGSHGQTLRHRPEAPHPFTLQIGDPNIIAERTGIPTIADFRRRDIAAGGQGAPLAPGFHAAVFGSEQEDRVIINIGGISNITILARDPHATIIGFDTGPGNCLMDFWTRKHWHIPFDNNGEIAAQGKVHEGLLQLCLEDPFFSKTPPKSTGRDYFTEHWLSKKLIPFQDNNPGFETEDIQATLLALTAQSLATAILKHAPVDASVYVCGGGVHNNFLMKSLNTLLNRTVKSTDSLGSPPDWIEAILFAWLAKQTLEGKSGNCPSVTGARHAIPLGGIFGLELAKAAL